MNSPADFIFAAASAASVAAGTFLYQNAEQATLSLNEAPVPAIVLYDYPLNQASATGKTQSAPITLYFATSVEGPGDNSEAHHVAVEAMRAMKRRFIAELDKSPFVQIDTIRDAPFKAAYQAELDGVGVQFTLTVPAGNYCEPAPQEAMSGFPYLLNFVLS
jgi:hypothetical protein